MGGAALAHGAESPKGFRKTVKTGGKKTPVR